jgi:hypothetical protein
MQILLHKSISLSPTGRHCAVPSVECVVLIPLYPGSWFWWDGGWKLVEMGGGAGADLRKWSAAVVLSFPFLPLSILHPSLPPTLRDLGGQSPSLQGVSKCCFS